MAGPITWRNVTPSNTSGILEQFQRAGGQLSDAVSGLGDVVTDFRDQRMEEATQAFLTDYNNLQTEAERDAFLQQANKAFLDLGQVNEAAISADTRERDIALHNQRIQEGQQNLALGELEVAAAERAASPEALELEALLRANQAAAARAASNNILLKDRDEEAQLAESARQRTEAARNRDNTEWIRSRVNEISNLPSGQQRTARIQEIIKEGQNRPNFDVTALKQQLSGYQDRDFEKEKIEVTLDRLGLSMPSFNPFANKTKLTDNEILALDDYRDTISAEVNRVYGNPVFGISESARTAKINKILEDTPGYTTARKRANRQLGVKAKVQEGIDEVVAQGAIDQQSFETKLANSTNRTTTIGAIKGRLLSDPQLKVGYERIEDEDGFAEDLFEIYNGIRDANTNLTETEVGQIMLRELAAGRADDNWQWWTDIKDSSGKDFDDYDKDDYLKIINNFLDPDGRPSEEPELRKTPRGRRG